MRRVREKKAQKAVNAWYDARYPDMRTTLTLRGRRGWPDEVYWLPLRPLLIEYKAEGEAPRKLQQYIHQNLKDQGYDIEVHVSGAEAIAALKRHIEARGSFRPTTVGARRVPTERGAVPVGPRSSRRVLVARPSQDQHHPRSHQDTSAREAD